MNIINLRKVSGQEISSSFRGILRISPNLFEDVIEDDATKLLKTENSTIELSDSAGDILPIKFTPKIYPTNIKSSNKDVNLIHIQHEYSNLFVPSSLNVLNNIIIENKTNLGNGVDITPLNFVLEDNNNIEILSYPIECPYDTRYFNANGRFALKGTFNYKNQEGIETTYNSNNNSNNNYDNFKEFYSGSDELEDHLIKIDGKKLIHTIKVKDENNKDKNVELPLLKRRSYIMGCPKGHVYKYDPNSDTSKYKLPSLPNLKNKDIIHTQLTFLPLEDLIYETLSMALEGVYRSDTGRYSNLLTNEDNGENELFNALFGNDKEADLILKRAPILGIGVQSGTIHYNAIPPHHYFFHLKRLTESNDTSSSQDNDVLWSTSPIENIIHEYVLCDGKLLSTDKDINEYKNINEAYLESIWGETHNSIRNSLPTPPKVEETEVVEENGEVGETEAPEEPKEFYTPRLFECNQLSLRFLRGLNWRRVYNKRKNDNGLEEMDDLSGNDIIQIGKADNSSTSATYIEKTEDGKSKKYELSIVDNDYEYNYKDYSGPKKDINAVGLYYSNIDRKGEYFNHAHLQFADVSKNKDELKGENLSNMATVFGGKWTDAVWYSNGALSHTADWQKYIKSDSNVFQNTGTVILKTAANLKIDDELLVKLQNQTISIGGGGNSTMYKIQDCVRFGTRHLWKCMNSRTRCQGPADIKDGQYYISQADGNIHTNWRFVSSLPIFPKLGSLDNKNKIIYSKAFYNPPPSTDNETGETSGDIEINIDDSLCSPHTLNFLPLMKI